MRVTIEIDEQTEALLNEIAKENFMSIAEVAESFVYYEVVRRQNWKDMCKENK